MKKLLIAVLLSAAFSCIAQNAAPDCERVAQVCAEPNETREIDGMPVFRECWRWTNTYQCRELATINNCQPLRDRGCAQVSTSCIDRASDGSCSVQENRMQCPVTQPRVEERNVCAPSFCQAGDAGCFDTSRPADQDFGQAAAAVEAARQAGVYGVNGADIEIFKGYMEQCSIQQLGGSNLNSCCSAAGGGQNFTNYRVIGVTAQAAYAVSSEEITAGSRWVYDALFQTQDAGLMQSGVSAATGGLTDAAAEGVAGSAGTSFGAYGFEFSYSAAGGFEFVSFDPYSFAFAIAVMIVMEWLSCEPEEQTMMMKRGQNLCVHIDTYCSRRALGACIESRQRHCCFNSILAKIINRQGRAQLGLPMNQCGGFNQDQLLALDFSAMDFSEFIATIEPRDNPQGENEARIRETVDERVRNFYEQ